MIVVWICVAALFISFRQCCHCHFSRPINWVDISGIWKFIVSKFKQWARWQIVSRPLLHVHCWADVAFGCWQASTWSWSMQLSWLSLWQCDSDLDINFTAGRGGAWGCCHLPRDGDEGVVVAVCVLFDSLPPLTYCHVVFSLIWFA